MIKVDSVAIERYISFLDSVRSKLVDVKDEFYRETKNKATLISNSLGDKIEIVNSRMNTLSQKISNLKSDIKNGYNLYIDTQNNIQENYNNLPSASDVGLSSGAVVSSGASYTYSSSSGSYSSDDVGMSNYDDIDDSSLTSNSSVSTEKNTVSKNEDINVEDLENIVKNLISLNITREQFVGITKVEADKGYFYVIELKCMNEDGKWKDNDITKYYMMDGKIVACELGDGRLAKKENGKYVYSDAKTKVTTESVAAFLGLTKIEKKDNVAKDTNSNKNENKASSSNNSNSTKKTSSSSTSKKSNDTVKVTGSNSLKGNVINTDKPVGIGTKYNLSDDQLARLACVAQREQGSVEGAKVELSLMANLYEKYKKNYDNVLDYVYNSGWFASGATNNYQYPGDAYVAAAREVINNGKRYLASNVVEHDYLGDLVYNSTGNIYDKSSYIPGKTVLQNQWGAKYVFVGFAPNGGDPFGYLIN